MYRYTILAVGKMKNSALASLCADYVKRLGRQGSCEVIELKDGTIAREGQRILDALQKRQEGIIYLLSEEGEERSSLAFAKELKQLHGRNVVFVIGGAYGILASVKEQSDHIIALSKMTLTHEMARVLLTEQLYRTAAINSGSNYHHS